jgi:uncharacterized protein (DUF488 family)
MPDSDSNTGKIVLTIGHSNRPLEGFMALLKAQEVNGVADVRKTPRSRKNPQFNGDTLPQALELVGIAYVWIPALGGMRLPRPDSPNTAWENSSFRGFADYMLTSEFEQGLQELLDQAQDRRVALMCSEAVPWRCHRSLIADVLVVRGFTVQHIFGVSRIQDHQLCSWASVEGTQVSYPSRKGAV